MTAPGTRRTALMWPPLVEPEEPPPDEPRVWSIPIDVRFKMRWRVPVNDRVAQVQFLLTERSVFFGGGPGSYAGVLLQNQSSDAPNLIMFPLAGGTSPDGSAFTFWAGGEQDGYLFDPSINGEWFWVRIRVESTTSMLAKIWHDSGAEPSTWQQSASLLPGGVARSVTEFDPSEIDWLWFFFDASDDSFAFDIDQLEITDGFGPVPLVDTFSRSVPAGWGTGPIAEWIVGGGAGDLNFSVADDIATYHESALENQSTVETVYLPNEA